MWACLLAVWRWQHRLLPGYSSISSSGPQLAQLAWQRARHLLDTLLQLCHGQQQSQQRRGHIRMLQQEQHQGRSSLRHQLQQQCLQHWVQAQGQVQRARAVAAALVKAIQAQAMQAQPPWPSLPYAPPL